MNEKQGEKFYVPIKLNRSATIGVFSVIDIGAMFLILIPTVLLLVGSKNILCLIPLLVFAVLRIRFGERTLGNKLKKIILHHAKPQTYLLKECIKPVEDNRIN